MFIIDQQVDDKSVIIYSMGVLLMGLALGLVYNSEPLGELESVNIW